MQINEEQARAILEVFIAADNEDLAFSPKAARVLDDIFTYFPSLKANEDFITLVDNDYLKKRRTE